MSTDGKIPVGYSTFGCTSPPPSQQNTANMTQDLEAAPLVPPSSSSKPASNMKSTLVLPSASRFLADFTLGFADGLTVPFALTAGLSSLGNSDTVIYAGAAEICAGSLSMGIGGYLSAKGDWSQSQQSHLQSRAQSPLPGQIADFDADLGIETETETVVSGYHGHEGQGFLDSYLAPLALSPKLQGEIRAHVANSPSILRELEQQQNHRHSHRCSEANSLNEKEAESKRAAPSPVLVGFSVSLGYLLGGLLPLFPYFFVEHVQEGLKWSFAVCILVLFLFGFLKDYFLNSHQTEGYERAEWIGTGGHKTDRMALGMKWSDLKRSLWEGVQMALMGGVAAVAAVLCVKFFEDMRV
ncbi:VIT family-domain-containing protein [Triangularia verruculosa]|uniref:VIT family-domain-containing protein n=1 Tax=Triangularia verruculosa TaxID=2587418 RepID=A0AAN6XJT3_9PEZI|nr:VIT family-domain-containing protein [Triangularia verruculosa]